MISGVADMHDTLQIIYGFLFCVFLFMAVSETSLETLWDLILMLFWDPKVSAILLLGLFYLGTVF